VINVENKAPRVGGAFIGLAVVVMHYTGMMAYHVDGIIVWNGDYILLSAILSMTLASLAFGALEAKEYPHRGLMALALFTLSVVALHFTGMAALTVMPMTTGAQLADQAAIRGMAVAVAGVAMIVVGTGVASYLIDARTTRDMVDKLRSLALTDSLTGLPNRTRFGDHLVYEYALARETVGRFAVIGIDLDRFKEINDQHGHDAGDDVLKIVGQRLQRLLKEGEFAGRIGGDEFAAAKRFTDVSDLRDFVARIERALFNPVRTDTFEVLVGGCIGVARYPEDGDTIERLLSNADLAMYRAKKEPGRSVCYYEAQMDEAARNRHALAKDLKLAIDNNELELFYQVQNSVATGAISGYEVLLRWNHSTRGMVPPHEFIPIAEETGSIVAIGAWVLQTACRDAARWNDDRKIAVNLSAVQFVNGDLAQLVQKTLADSGLPARRLELELTETTIVADKFRTLQTLRQIKELGVTIAIDDFGTGYSSLDTLRAFPFDRIKLDRSFVREVDQSQQAKAIVRAVLALGKSLEINVLAEGVETKEQLAVLREEGCDDVQGFLLGRPTPERQTEIWIETPTKSLQLESHGAGMKAA
jgi:diguanylate cyclase